MQGQGLYLCVSAAFCGQFAGYAPSGCDNIYLIAHYNRPCRSCDERLCEDSGLRLNGRPNRFALLMMMLGLCGFLVVLALAGVLSPVEAVVAAPLNGLSGAFNRLSVSFNQAVDELNNLGQLRERIAELEEQLARGQIELLQLREAASDYDRLVSLLS